MKRRRYHHRSCAHGDRHTAIRSSNVHGERRIEPRHLLLETMELRMSRCRQPACLVNISRSGSRLHVKQGFMPGLADDITLSLLDGTYLWGHVVWEKGPELGMAFPDLLATIDDFAWPETRDPDWWLNLNRRMSR